MKVFLSSIIELVPHGGVHSKRVPKTQTTEKENNKWLLAGPD